MIIIYCCRFIDIHTGGNQHYIFSIKSHIDVPKKHVGFSLPQRKWAVLSLNQEIDVKPTKVEEYLTTIVVEADYMQKKT